MAYEIPGFSFPLPAAADLRTSQFRFVNVDATGKAALPTAGGRVVGVCNNKPNTNQATTVVASGISQVVAGAAVTAGAILETDATGRAITRATGIPVGIALETASAAGVIIAVLVRPHVV